MRHGASDGELDVVVVALTALVMSLVMALASRIRYRQWQPALLVRDM
jgi:hypothetical protein